MKKFLRSFLTECADEDISFHLLISTFGKERAEELLKEVGTEIQPLEDDLQQIVDSAPALDEI